MLILTNFERFPENWTSGYGLQGKAIPVYTVWDVVRHSRGAGMVLLNGDATLAMKLVILYFLLPFLRLPIVLADIVLRPPRTVRSRMVARVKKLLLSRVDHFVLYFRNLDGYQKYFGIGPERCSYVKFKPNIRYRQKFAVSPEGDYVLCLGWSERDYDTFFAAMKGLPYPGAIPQPNFAQLRKHGSRLSCELSEVPSNVQLLADDGSDESLVHMLEHAAIVALPLVPGRISPSGIGIYLNAMLMGKLVITTEGHGASDVLNGEAVLVPEADVYSLQGAIQHAWEDQDYRLKIASRGRRYAETCGGEPELRQRVLDSALAACFPQRIPQTGRETEAA